MTIGAELHGAVTAPPLPCARGPLSAFVLDHITEPVHRLGAGPRIEDDPATGDDLQLALYGCYELHYRGFDGVDDEWEWEPSLLDLRRRLERAFEEAVGATAPRPVVAASEVGPRLEELAHADGPSLSRTMEACGTRRQFQEFAIHRSAYQLKEADPHTWGIPRFAGGPKSAMVEIQTDEYGGGVPGASHAELFAATMAALGLDPSYGAYLDLLPGTTLATVNLVSLFGLHRRHRGALIGHLALFEMTSVLPMARYSRALTRLGFDAGARRFYDIHVEADVHHAAVAAGAMAGGLAADEPALAADILFGAQALMAVEARFTSHMLGAWSAGRTSLLAPVPCPTA